jgi:hypothetical protein
MCGPSPILAVPGGGRWQVSKGGGVDPRSRSDGKELFYYSGLNDFVAATIDANASDFSVVRTETLFQARRAEGSTNYAVMRDGQKFIVNTISEKSGAPAITVIVNWPTGLKP